MNNKDKKLLKKFRQLSTQLPALSHNVRHNVSGEELIKKGILKLKTGEEVDPKMNYSFEVDTPKSTYRKLKKLFASGGVNAVNDYIKSINEMTINAIVGQNEIIGGMNDRANQFSI